MAWPPKKDFIPQRLFPPFHFIGAMWLAPVPTSWIMQENGVSGSPRLPSRVSWISRKISRTRNREENCVLVASSFAWRDWTLDDRNRAPYTCKWDSGRRSFVQISAVSRSAWKWCNFFAELRGGCLIRYLGDRSCILRCRYANPNSVSASEDCGARHQIVDLEVKARWALERSRLN